MRRRTLLIAGAVAVVLAVIAGAVALQQPRLPAAVTGTPTPPPGATPYTSDLGYTIQLPPGWRRSDVLSGRPPATSLVAIGWDVFTVRTVAEEKASLGGETGGPASFWTLDVEVAKNRDGLSLRQWIDEGRVGFATGQRIEDATVDGKPGLRLVNGARHAVAYLVGRGDEIVTAGYRTGPDALPGASREVLERMLGSIRIEPNAVARPSTSHAPNASTVANIETYPLGNLTDDWTLVTRLRTDAQGTSTEELWAIEMFGERRLLVAQWLEPRSFTRTILRKQLSPDRRRLLVSLPVDPNPAAPNPSYVVCLVDLATGGTRIVLEEPRTRFLWPAWSLDGSRIAYIRGSAEDAPSLWTADANGGSRRGPLTNASILFGWSPDASSIAYRTRDGWLALLEIASGATTLPGMIISGEQDPVDWRAPSDAFKPQLVAALSQTPGGGEQTLAVFEKVGAPMQVVLRDPAPPDYASFLFEPRWSAVGPIVLFRRGSSLFTTGGFVDASARQQKVATSGKVLRAEWAPAQAGAERVVYIIDGQDGQNRGASLRIVQRDGGNDRTLFVPPPIGDAVISSLDDLATARWR